MELKSDQYLNIYIGIEGVEVKRCSGKSQSYKKHLHRELSIGLIEKGSTSVDFGGENYTFKENDLIVIPPLLSHKCSPADLNQWQFIMIYIDVRYYEGKMAFNRAMKMQGEAVQKFNDFIKLTATVYDQNILEESLIELFLALKNADEEDKLFEFQEIEDLKIFRVKQYIEAHFKEELALKKLENRFALNKFTLIRKFKEKFNTTPNAYKLQLKTAEAKKFLDHGVDVFEICRELGFYDQAHFIREFKKMNGMSPAVYLNSIRRK